MSEPEAPIRPTMMAPPQRASPVAVVVGLLLVLPALVLLLVSYVEPTIWTLRSSVQEGTIVPIFRDKPSNDGFTFDNFGDLFQRGFASDVAAALLFALVPILVALVAAPVLAWAAHTGGTATRWVTRGLLAFPLAAYAPSAYLAGGILDYGIQDTWRLYWLGTFGLIAAVAVTVYLAALRRRDPDRRPWAALAVVAGITVVAVVTAALQEFTYSAVLPTRDPAPPMGKLFAFGSRVFDFGPAVAGSALVALVVMLLGALVTVVIVLSGLRLEFDPTYRSADAGGGSPRRVAAVVIWVVALVVVLALTTYGLLPELKHFFDEAGGPATFTDVVVNTWLPPFLATTTGVLAAAAAAVGIGWLRPFGRHSEWLLLPFGLFLFVGLGPLAVRFYARQVESGMVSTFAGLIPPWLVALPALFVLTLFLRGQALRGQAARQLGQPIPAARLLLPVLPMVGIAFLATWVVQAQDLGWSFLANQTTDREDLTGPTAVYLSQRFLVVPVGVVLPVALFGLLFVLIVAAQLLYLDRVALRVGRPERDLPPRA